MVECVLGSGEGRDEALTGGGGMRVVVVVVVVSCRCRGAHVAECVLENGRRWRWDTNRWGRNAGGGGGGVMPLHRSSCGRVRAGKWEEVEMGH